MSQPSNVTIRPGLEGYFAPADTDSPAPGILVLMEAFGLTDHIRRACDHFAAQGINALAPTSTMASGSATTSWIRRSPPSADSTTNR